MVRDRFGAELPPTTRRTGGGRDAQRRRAVIRFPCANCGKRLKTEERDSGKQSTCPRCRCPNLIPPVADPEEPTPPPPAIVYESTEPSEGLVPTPSGSPTIAELERIQLEYTRGHVTGLHRQTDVLTVGGGAVTGLVRASGRLSAVHFGRFQVTLDVHSQVLDRCDFWVRTPTGRETRVVYHGAVLPIRDGHSVGVLIATNPDTSTSVVVAVVNYTCEEIVQGVRTSIRCDPL